MIRTLYILVFAIITTFYLNYRVADSVMEYDKIQPAEAIFDEDETILEQDNSAFLFVYWDEHVRTTLSEFKETNRQPPQKTGITLSGNTPPASEYSTTPIGIGPPDTKSYSSGQENPVVVLHKFRI